MNHAVELTTLPFSERILNWVPLLTGFIAFVSLFRTVLWWEGRRKKLLVLGQRAPAVPSSLPFGIGLLFTIVKRINADEFFEWAREALKVPGHTVDLRILGNSIIMTDEPENIRTVLSTKFSSFGKGDAFHHAWQDLMLDSVFATDGEVWHRNKNYLRDHTAKFRPTDYSITEKHARTLIRKLSDGKAHDCFDEIDRFSLDTVSDIFFGTSAGTLLAEEQPIRETVERMYNSNTQKLLLGDLAKFLPWDKAGNQLIDEYLENLIDTAKSALASDSDEKGRVDQSLLGSMIERGTNQELIKDQLMAILLGGKACWHRLLRTSLVMLNVAVQDPVSLTITWALYELARHPAMIDKLRCQIESVLGMVNPPDAQALRNMPYLHNTILETLRLHSPLGFNIRTALKDASLPIGGGADGTTPIAIPKGTHIIMANACVQRRVDLIGADADEFNPDRWENEWKPALWAYLPFNHGPRICLGKNFAFMQMEFLVCRILQAFRRVDFVGLEGGKLNKDGEVGIRIALNTKPAGSIMLRFVE